MNLSIIIPVLNEAEKISEDITSLSDYLTNNNITGEIIVSDDGSTDGTSEIANETSLTDNVCLVILKENEHYGKGHAVRKGILESKGDIVMFIDSGKTVTLDFINNGIDMIRNNEYQIILGSRHLPESIIRKQLVWYRRLVSILFRIVTKLLFPSMWGFSDTQCGFKCFRRDAGRQIFARQRIWRFSFDVELLWIARKLGYRVTEVPVTWVNDPSSRVHPLRDSLRMLVDLVRVRYNDLRGVYQFGEGPSV